jgi:methyl-accepting chemotaxis protein
MSSYRAETPSRWVTAMLNSLLSNLRIGTKVLSIAVIALIGFAAILVTLLTTDHMRNQVDARQEAALSEYMVVQNISEDFLNARRREKDFLLRKDKAFADKHDEVTAKISGEIQSLLDHASPDEADALKKLQGLYGEYDSRFKEIAGDTIAMGLTADDGLLGKLRKSVHDIEDSLKAFDDPQLTISMLMMRRHEKDFIAREDPKYIDSLTKERAHFDELVKASTIAADMQTKLTTLSSAYDASFQEMAKLQLTIKDKLKGMSESYAAAEPILEAARKASNDRYNAAKIEMLRIEDLARKIMFGSVIVIGIVILILAWLIGRGISRPVVHLAMR